MRIIVKLIVVVLLLLFGIITIVFVVDMLSARDYDWKSKTTPLPPEKIAILCENFDLPQDFRLCSGKKEIYGPDFYEIIRDTFRPYEEYNIDSSEAATYDEVEEKLGTFKYDCLPVVQQADGFTYFRCAYDLRGDGEFIIGIIFTYPDNAVFRINTPMGYDGE